MNLIKKIKGHYVYLDEDRRVVICKRCDGELSPVTRWIIPQNINTPCFYFNICWDCFMEKIYGTIQHYNFVKKYQKHLIKNKLFDKFKN